MRGPTKKNEKIKVSGVIFRQRHILSVPGVLYEQLSRDCSHRDYIGDIVIVAA
jgi:hypothetical protein